MSATFVRAAKLLALLSTGLLLSTLGAAGASGPTRRAAAELVEAYWKPLWQWSSRAAVSGDGAERCIFREAAK